MAFNLADTLELPSEREEVVSSPPLHVLISLVWDMTLMGVLKAPQIFPVFS